jgi:hypothetical protein
LENNNFIYLFFIFLDENIPIRFFLSPYELSPTQTSVNNRFSTQYFINLVLLDVEERRYFKQHEIFLVRVDKKKKESLTETSD